MADEDKLLGIAKVGRDTTYTYSAYRIDYDSADSIQDLAAEETEFTGAVKNPPAGYPGHEAKTDYQRKVLVEDDPTREEVVTVLDNNSVTHTVESVEPTADEKAHIEDYEAANSLEGADAMAWKRALEDLEAGNISEVDLERGRNPHRNESVGRPNPGRGRGNN